MKSAEITKRGRGRPKMGSDFIEISTSSSSSSTSSGGSDSDNNNSGRSNVDISQEERSQKSQSLPSWPSSSPSPSSMALTQVVKTGTVGVPSSEARRVSELCLVPSCQPLACQSPSQSIESRNRDSGLSTVETRWGCFGAGEKVFAYWKGKTTFSTGYYSGTIIQKGVLNVYNIHFDDNTVSNTSEAQILPLRILGVNVKVFYLADDACTGPLSAWVVGQKYLNSDGGSDDVEYVIKCFGSDTQPVHCKRKQLYLGVQQAKELRKKYESVQPKFGDVNLDNVILGPRQRVTPTPKPTETAVKRRSLPEEPSARQKSIKSGASTRKSAKKKRVENPAVILHDQPTKHDSISQAENCGVKKPTQKVLPIEVTSDRAKASLSQVKYMLSNQNSKTEKQQIRTDAFKAPLPAKDNAQTTVKSSTNNSHLKSLKVKHSEDVSKSQNDLPLHSKVKRKQIEGRESATKTRDIKGSLFRGYHFFLTAGDRNQMKGVEVGKEISKTDMQGMIVSQQGNELLSLGDEKNKDPTKVFLLASCHLRTLKYLYCIATGIPCVAQKWMEDCVNSNTLLDWKTYQLSPGWSIELGRLAAPHTNCPLENMTIGLATFKKDTIDTWIKLIPAAKAVVKISTDFHHERQPAEMKPPDDWLNGSIDILVSDFACPKDICEIMESKGIPLVRIEWLVQTIIVGKKSDYRVGEGYVH